MHRLMFLILMVLMPTVARDGIYFDGKEIETLGVKKQDGVYEPIREKKNI